MTNDEWRMMNDEWRMMTDWWLTDDFWVVIDDCLIFFVSTCSLSRAGAWLTITKTMPAEFVFPENQAKNSQLIFLEPLQRSIEKLLCTCAHTSSKHAPPPVAEQRQEVAMRTKKEAHRHKWRWISIKIKWTQIADDAYEKRKECRLH